jgi:hypothetical protein
MVDFIGGRRRTRTSDPLIKSQLLYHLSYAPDFFRLCLRLGAGLRVLPTGYPAKRCSP